MKDDDDKLLSALGRMAKEGELTPEEIADLERRADEEAKAFVLASRPLDADARARIVEKIAFSLPRKKPTMRGAAWRSRAPMVLGALALAAVIAFVLRPKPPGDLPLYEIESSGVSSARAPAATPSSCVLHASSTGSFELLVRANDAVHGSIVAHAFAERASGIERIATDIEVSPTGSVRVSAPNARLEGAKAILVVVGRSEALDADTALTKAREGRSGAGFQTLRCAVD